MEILSYLDHRIPSSPSHQRRGCVGRNKIENHEFVASSHRYYSSSSSSSRCYDEEFQQLQFLINGYDEKQRRQQQSNNRHRYLHTPTADSIPMNVANNTSTVITDDASSSTTTTTTTRHEGNCSAQSAKTVPALDVFPIEVLRLLTSCGFLTTKQLVKFLLLTSKTFVKEIGPSYVWKSLCCQHWPVVDLIMLTQQQQQQQQRRIQDNNINNNKKNHDDDDDDDFYLNYYQKLFYQLLRPAKLRSFDYNYHNHNNHPIGLQYYSDRKGLLRFRHHRRNRFNNHHHHHDRPKFDILDSISFTIMIRFGNNMLESYRLDAFQMQQLVDTGTVCIVRNNSSSCNDAMPLPRSAYWHIWKNDNHSNNNQDDDDEILVTCLNESHRPVWNTEKNGYQFLTHYVQLSSRGRLLEEEQQQQQNDIGFGGLKFQIIVSESNIRLEIRKRHGRHPTGLYYRSSSVDDNKSRTVSNHTSARSKTIGLLDFLQELAGWES